jgi:hypothetical protein
MIGPDGPRGGIVDNSRKIPSEFPNLSKASELVVFLRESSTSRKNDYVNSTDSKAFRINPGFRPVSNHFDTGTCPN